MTNKMDRIQRMVVTQHRLIAAILFTGLTMFVSTPGVEAAFFDSAGKSARAMGMGEVFLASSDDALGYWYNPAGLANLESRQIGLGYGKPAAAISSLMSSQLNVAMPLGEGSGLGLGFAYGGISEATDMVVSGAYGLSLGGLDVGANVKVMYWSMTGQDNEYGPGTDEDLSKVSFSLDASAQYSLGSMMGLDEVGAGVYVRDAIMPNISESGDDGGQLPIEAGVGLMVRQNDITIGGDVGFVDGSTVLRAGAETPIGGSNLRVRSGFVFESDFEDELERADLGLGLGYSFGSLMFDYAYNVPFAMKETNGKHFVSFGFSF